MEVGTNGLSIAANGNFLAKVAGTTIFQVGVTAALLVNEHGIAAKIGFTLGTLTPSSGTGFNLGGTFTFELNTTNDQIDNIGGVAVNLAAGRYVRLNIAGQVQLTIVSGTGFRLEGSFTMTAGTNGLEVAATAQLKAIVGGVTLLNFGATGALLINQNGIAAKITLNIGAGYSGAGFKFTGNFEFDLNTTGLFISSIAGQAVNLPGGGVYARISASGKLTLLSVLDLNGSFTFQFSSQGVSVAVNATLKVFGLTFTANVNATINSSGIVFSVAISLSGATNFIPVNNIEIFGTFTLEVNTTSAAAQNIPAQTVRIKVAGGINIFGFKATGGVIISIGAGGFRIEVPDHVLPDGTGPLSLSLGPISIQFSGFLDSNGTFLFTASGGVHATAGPAFLDADASVTIGNNPLLFKFHLDGSAGIKVAGHKIGIDVHADVTLSGSHLEIQVCACIDLLFGDACACVTFGLGDLDLPGAATAPPPPVLATLLPGNVLRLNMGTYAFARNDDSTLNVQDESFEVTHVSGSVGNETVTVSAFGFDQR